MDPKIDPFRFDTEAGHRDGRSFRNAMQAAGLLDRARPIHLRGAHYAVTQMSPPLTRPDPGFVEGLTVDRFHGVGPATAAKMNRLGIFTALDLRAKDEAFLRTHFGKAGPHYFNICRGIDHRPVCANRVRKSVGAENTPRDLSSYDEMKAELEPLGYLCTTLNRRYLCARRTQMRSMS